MPIRPDELSAFFDKLYVVLREQWERAVDRGDMTDIGKERRLARLDDIGAILRALGEGKAALTYQQAPPRKPAPLIFLRPEAIDDL
jgi:hypothetical protein